MADGRRASVGRRGIAGGEAFVARLVFLRPLTLGLVGHRLGSGIAYLGDVFTRFLAGRKRRRAAVLRFLVELPTGITERSKSGHSDQSHGRTFLLSFPANARSARRFIRRE